MELFPSKLTSILGITGENPTEIGKTYTEPSRGKKISISYSNLKSLCWLERIEPNAHYEQPLAKVRSSSRWVFNCQIRTAFRTRRWNKGFTKVSENGPRAALEVVYSRLLCSIFTHTFALHRWCNHFGFGLTKHTRKALLRNTWQERRQLRHVLFCTQSKISLHQRSTSLENFPEREVKNLSVSQRDSSESAWGSLSGFNPQKYHLQHFYVFLIGLSANFLWEIDAILIRPGSV